MELETKALEALRELVPFAVSYLRLLQIEQQDEIGHCPACGPEDYCYNHQTQIDLSRALDNALGVLAR